MRSTVGLKVAMALSGLVMLAYLIVHAYGNLKFFYGQTMFDHYLEGLRTALYPYLPHEGMLTLVRLALVVSFVVHVCCAITLWRRNARAAGYSRGRRYQSTRNRTGLQRSYASFTMRWGGVVLLLFIIGHVAQMVPNYLHPGGASQSKYERVVNGFELWWVVLLYSIGLIALGFHLWHGFWSATATLGQNFSPTRRASLATTVASVLSVVLVGTFLSVPFAVFFFGAGS